MYHFSGVNGQGREANHSRLSSVEVKNEWSYTSAPTVCIRGVDRYNFTFAFYGH